MLPPVVCLSCGCPLGHIATTFYRLREEKARKALGGGLIPRNLINEALESVEMSDELTALGIPMDDWCCRSALNTSMLLADYY